MSVWWMEKSENQCLNGVMLHTGEHWSDGLMEWDFYYYPYSVPTTILRLKLGISKVFPSDMRF